MTFRAGRALASGLRAWSEHFLPAVGVTALCWAPVAVLLPGVVDVLDSRSAAFAFFCFLGIGVYAPFLVGLLLFSGFENLELGTTGWIWPS